MNDQEIDLMDELYFVQSYKEVKDALGWKDENLQNQLLGLYKREFIKILIDHDQDYPHKIESIESVPWGELYFLATKKGLLEHNGF
jgi:hypothetical protein